MEDLKSGRGIQVVTPGPEHTFVLDEEELESLLLRDDVKDCSIVVISVAGAFRKGKSFLLDFFLRYMHHRYNLGGSGDWLGSEDEPLQGFGWRGGSERDTTGLLLWSQPFKTTLENGEKVVVYLMDTQGTFDSESTVRDNATVFALSTMLSSVQIYNLSQNIEEDDLQHLQLFTDYGRLAQETSGGKPFQRLQLLVRDWSFPYEHAYGVEGGQELLTKRLTVHEGQHHELQSLRKHIASCFEELACFLMPHPGLNVATNPEFNGKLSDIGQDFKIALKQFVPMLLAPENLIPKRIGGQQLKSRDLLLYFRSYMNIFNGTSLPEPKTILEATAEANNLSAVAEAKEVYETLMEEVAGGAKPYLQPQLLEEEHRRARDKALHSFHSKKKMGGDSLSATYSIKLTKELEEQYEQYRLHNEDKNLLRKLGTAAVLGALALACYLVSILAGVLGLQTFAMLGQTAALACLGMLFVWAYSRATGNMRELGSQMDQIADTVMELAGQYAGKQAAAVAMSYSAEKTNYSADKKQS
ncbi:atlastin-like isoform X1 [Maniola jurtina]|nr:atlastin-like isoform X1 [Maniola jurtina]XP_045776499.1 atlastin-like isoform X1 [Maniola jurtina]